MSMEFSATVMNAQGVKLPRLLVFGSEQCPPCVVMAPGLGELQKQYAGRLAVEYFDVTKTGAIARQFGVEATPTAVFLAPDGQELSRHEGFLGKADILKRWEQLNYRF